LIDFVHRILKDLTNAIEKDYPNLEQVDPLVQEKKNHEYFAKARSARFIG
jgi:hypothetical protein